METDLAYIAGIFDGEGCISVFVIRRAGHIDNFNLQASVGMTCPFAVEKIRDAFGGRLYANRASERNVKHRTAYYWVKNSLGASKFLRAIRPYTLVKSAEIDVALELQDNITEWKHKLRFKTSANTSGTHPKTAEVIEWRYAMKRRLGELKRVRHASPITPYPATLTTSSI